MTEAGGEDRAIRHDPVMPQQVLEALAVAPGRLYVDATLGSSSKSGYDFFLAGVIDNWVCLANPRTVGTSGDRFFFADQTGTIRFSTAGPASSASPPID